MPRQSATSSLEYLQSLFEMAEEQIPLVQSRLAGWMGVSAASASEAVKRLRRDGLVDGGGRELTMTPEGEEVARRLVRRHRLAERFLIEVLGIPWHRAHEEAGAWERAISDEVEERVAAILNDPATCPHGNPIPGSSHPVDLSDLRPLPTFRPGARVVLLRLTEDLELDLDVMRYLEETGLMPGATVAVRDLAPDGTMTLQVDGRQVGLGPELTDNLWVREA